MGLLNAYEVARLGTAALLFYVARSGGGLSSGGGGGESFAWEEATEMFPFFACDSSVGIANKPVMLESAALFDSTEGC